MTLWDRLTGRPPREEQRTVNADVFLDAAAARRSPTGKNITPASALSGTVAVFAAVSLLAETTGSLPLHTYKRIDDRTRERVASTPLRWPGTLARSLHESPNPEMSATEYWEMVVGHCATWGNHYSYIVRDAYGRPQELWPLRPDMMTVSRNLWSDPKLGPRLYTYKTPNGEPHGLTRNEVMHVMDFGTDGTVGMSPIGVARVGVGIEQAAAQYAGSFFGNSAIPGGILSTPKEITKDAAAALGEQWQSVVGGLNNAQRTAVLHSGLTWQAVGLPPKDAQFIELRRFQVEEVARLYRIPLHLLADTTPSTSWGTGIEQMTIGFVVYTLRPRLRRIEAAINRDLGDVAANRTLLDGGLFCEFQINGLLRGDMQSRSAFYESGIQNGWMLPEDARALENLPYVSGLDRPWMPMNFNPVGPDGMPMRPDLAALPKSPEPDAAEPEEEPEAKSKARVFDEAYMKHMAGLAK